MAHAPADDWQSGKTVVQCNRYMLENHDSCDILFLVGQQRKPIAAHRYMMISRSDKFREMLEGNRQPELALPDINEETFNILLRFIYCDEDGEVTAENSMTILAAAKKYQLPMLVKKCERFLTKGPEVRNVCQQLEFAHIHNNDKLRDKCLKFIEEKPDQILEVENIVALCSECLTLIVKSDNISVNDEKLFELLLAYGRKKCEQQNIDPSVDNLRAVLGEAINHVRYPLMSVDFFTDQVEPTGILTEKHCLVLYRYFQKRQQNKPCDIQEFSAKPRKNLPVVYRFEETASEWGNDGQKADAITFQCTEDIFIRSIQVYGTCFGPDKLHVSMRLVQEPYGAVVMTKSVTLETDGKQEVYDIRLEEPRKIKKGKDFTIIMKIKGMPTFYGVKGKKEIEMEHVKFTFTDSEKRSTNKTNVLRGQLPGFTYELCPDQ